MRSMREPTECAEPYCPYYRSAVELIGRRWNGAIVRALLTGITRFGDLRKTIPDLSDKMLSERLKELEYTGIVERVVIPATPVRIEYRLTPKGRALAGIVQAVITWSDEWVRRGQTPAAAPRSVSRVASEKS